MWLFDKIGEVGLLKSCISPLGHGPVKVNTSRVWGVLV